jgi:3-hexulose-6-phosphate synthase/6-phospho-3-hexuloisomerase
MTDLIKPPIVQVAIDVMDVDQALRIAEAAVNAGADWLEAGTPLITFAGTPCIGALARAFPEMPVLADYKAMDGVRKYVVETKAQGGHIMTVCAVAHDASVTTAVEAGRETGVGVISDLYASLDMPQRAAEVEALGVAAVYAHWGSDARTRDPKRDVLADLAPVMDRVAIPVGASTFSAEEGARAARLGAEIMVIGFPLIQGPDIEGSLRAYVDAVKSAYRPR